MPHAPKSRHQYEPASTDRVVGKVLRAVSKPCRWCDARPDYKLTCGNETQWACALDIDKIEQQMRARHPKRFEVLWFRVVD